MTANRKISVYLNWQDISTVLLDMDGTLLDKHFDDYFWEHYVPQTYAEKNGLPLDIARQKLLASYKSREGSLEWTDLDFWSTELGLDIPALKIKVDHLIQVHPFVIEFLKDCRDKGKKVHMVTNAHGKTLDIKLGKTSIGGYFDSIVCSQEIGVAKEDRLFWPELQERLDFDPESTMLADDTEKVLRAAKEYGMGWLIFVAKPSSKNPVKYSLEFPSILYFKELMPVKSGRSV